jgi:hypothetical protein
MVRNASHFYKLLGALLGVAMAAVVAAAGVVQPLLPQCGAMPTDCNTYQCNTATGEWRVTGKKVNGAACNDGNVCTTGDKCQSGVCAGTPPVTNDNNACTADSYNPTTCVVVHTKLTNACCANGVAITTNQCCTSGTAKTNGSLCNDGNACTQSDTCQAGVCVGANPVVCTASDQCHLVGTCNSSTGACSNPAKLNGASCDDGSACTQTDTCQAGICVGANPVVCTASDQCHTAGTCNTSTGQCSNPLKQPGTPCEDTANCGCSTAGVRAFTVDRTNYCYDQAGNATATLVRAAGDACFVGGCP